LNPAASPRTLTLAARADQVRSATSWLQAQAAGLPAQVLGRLELCLHEALANVLEHAGLPAGASIGLELQLQAGRACLILRDPGRAFNPCLAVPVPRATRLEQTLPGGLGLVMLRANADQLEYAYVAERNQLSISVCWRMV